MENLELQRDEFESQEEARQGTRRTRMRTLSPRGLIQQIESVIQVCPLHLRRREM
jgi:hypothetical protein